MSAETRPRPAASTAAGTPTADPGGPVVSPTKLPFLLDFFPLETADQTRLSRFFDRLREGHVATTQCAEHGLLWPPRTACPRCHSESLAWVDLPTTGRLYAFSAVLGGAPLGMEADVPFAVGLIDLDGATLRLFGRIVGAPWTELRIGGSVRLEPYDLGDGRWFYRFRAGP